MNPMLETSMAVNMKKKVFLKKEQRAAMKEECRIALEYPFRSHARGAAVHEIAERYNVTTGVVYDTMNATRRLPAKTAPKAATNGTHAPVAHTPIAPIAAIVTTTAPVTHPAVYSLTIGDVTISAPTKESVLAVVARLLDAR